MSGCFSTEWLGSGAAVIDAPALDAASGRVCSEMRGTFRQTCVAKWQDRFSPAENLQLALGQRLLKGFTVVWEEPPHHLSLPNNVTNAPGAFRGCEKEIRGL